LHEPRIADDGSTANAWNRLFFIGRRLACPGDAFTLEVVMATVSEVVNARHIKNVPGRKTDVKDCQWISQLLAAGLPSPSFVPDRPQRELRVKIPQLTEALTGGVNDHHRFMLKTVLDQVEYLEKQIGWFDERIEQVMSPLELAAVQKLDEIPGFDKRAAQNVLGEIGTDMNRFPTQGHLASWAGLCPGNNKSAGKRKSGRMTGGNKWLKRTLNQTAWAGSRTRASCFRAQFQRLTKRRGAKRAAMAVAHSQLSVAWQLLKHDKAFVDLGVDYFEKKNSQNLKQRLIDKLKRLGCKVTIESDAA
jgi:transposase